MPTFNYPHSWAGFRFRERAPGSPSYRFGHENSRSSTIFMLEWRNDGNFARDLVKGFIGYARVETADGGIKYISREIPHPHLAFENFFYADTVEVVGDVPAGQDARLSGKFDEAKLTVHYSVPDYPIMSDGFLKAFQALLNMQSQYPDESTLIRNVRVTWQPAAKWQTLPSLQALRFDAAAVANRHPVSTTATTLLVEGELLVEWLGIPISGLPTTAITACVGKTNAAAFGALSPVLSQIFGPTGVEAGTMICQMPRIKRPWRQADGAFVTDVGYIFRVFPRGANSFYFWDAPTGGGFTGPGFYPASRTGDGTDPLFPTADFTALFKPE